LIKKVTKQRSQEGARRSLTSAVGKGARKSLNSAVGKGASGPKMRLSIVNPSAPPLVYTNNYFESNSRSIYFLAGFDPDPAGARSGSLWIGASFGPLAPFPTALFRDLLAPS